MISFGALALPEMGALSLAEDFDVGTWALPELLAPPGLRPLMVEQEKVYDCKRRCIGITEEV